MYALQLLHFLSVFPIEFEAIDYTSVLISLCASPLVCFGLALVPGPLLATGASRTKRLSFGTPPFPTPKQKVHSFFFRYLVNTLFWKYSVTGRPRYQQRLRYRMHCRGRKSRQYGGYDTSSSPRPAHIMCLPWCFGKVCFIVEATAMPIPPPAPARRFFQTLHLLSLPLHAKHTSKGEVQRYNTLRHMQP